MADRISAKSILKQSPNKTSPTVSEEQKARAERDRRNLGIALYHANKIQSQKDVQAAILSHIEKLLEYPAAPVPTPPEAVDFTALITSFQPSDFDSLVEERRIDGRCGYALCANSPRSATLGPNAAWKLNGKSAGDYCSNECLRKALYVKAQLSEVPAWERQPGQQPDIILPQEDRPPVKSPLPDVSMRTSSRLVNDSELAAERGEHAGSFRPNQVMQDNIVEKRSATFKALAPVKANNDSHDSIEGYLPIRPAKNVPLSSESPIPEKPRPQDNQSLTSKKQRPLDEEEESWDALFENLSER